MAEDDEGGGVRGKSSCVDHGPFNEGGHGRKQGSKGQK